MRVIFTRTGPRRYGVRAEPAGFPPVEMNPAPGYDQYLPHDLVHFVVEQQLDLSLGVFGQLAAGGDAGTFHAAVMQHRSREGTRSQRKTKRRGSGLAVEGRPDAELSEQAASICHYEWLRRSEYPELRAKAKAMAPYIARLRSDSRIAMRRVSDSAIERICARLDALSAEWRQLAVGGSLEVTWR